MPVTASTTGRTRSLQIVVGALVVALSTVTLLTAPSGASPSATATVAGATASSSAATPTLLPLRAPDQYVPRQGAKFNHWNIKKYRYTIRRHMLRTINSTPRGATIRWIVFSFGDWAIERPYVNYAAYFPSKGAIPALTRSLAVELGTRNPKVRVNCIMPGPVMIPPELSQAERDLSINATLVKREGRPENIVQAVLRFIDNDFLTGVCLPVDGGRTIYSSDSDCSR